MTTAIRVLLILLCLAGLAVLAPESPAQTLSGTVAGTVSDASGAVVPSAAVTITNVETKVTVWKGRTDPAGSYRAPGIPAGRYDLSFEAPGFQKFEVKGIVLAIDQRARVDATLRPGEVAQSVTVTAESASRLDTESAVVGTTIDPSQITDLPIAGRSVTNLLTLVTGVVNSGSGSSVNWWQMSINGTRTLNYEFTLDGISVISGVTGNIGTLPAPDAIREFKVQTSGYSAEYGRTSGATVSSVIASGTNQLHGSVYEYLRNEAFNANGFFNNLRGIRRPRDRYHQFGGTLGGPLLLPGLYNGRERTFFFYNLDKQLLRTPSTPNVTVPDAAFRSGDFSASPVVVHDPLSSSPFPGNRIPQNRIDPAARKITGLMPAPNSPGVADPVVNRRLNNFFSSQVLSRGPIRHTGRLDHSVGAAARLFGSLSYFSNPQPAAYFLPGPLNNNIGFQDDHGFTANTGYTHVWRPDFITEVRLGFTREYSARDPDTLGINVAEVFGIARSPAASAPRLQIAGWPEMGTNVNTYFRTVNNTWQTSTAATWVRSGHLVKFGLQLRKNQHNAFNPGGQWMGIYAFSGEMTSPNRVGGVATQGLADFLLGLVKTANYDLPQPMSGRRNSNLGLFINDDWKVSRRLTLNAGLRYEYESPVTASNNIYSRLDPWTGKLLAAAKNASRDLNLPTPKLNLAPRLGVAYSLTGRSVLRAAAGAFYGQIFSNLGGITSYPGYQVAQTFPNLGAGVAQPFSLSQGLPLIAVQDLNNPFQAERNATPSNPLFTGASYASVTPLPLTYQWNFGLQHNLGRGVIVDATYLGTRGLHLPLFLTMNAVPVERGEEVAFLATTVAAQMARPFPTLGAFGAQFHAGDSIYHSLQLTASRQLASGLSFRASYTFSKTIDDGSGIYNYSQPHGIDSGQFPERFRRLDRSLSSFDMPHNFVVAAQYRTPGPKWVRGWDVNPIFIARSGLPDTINQSNLHPGITQQRPSAVSGQSIYLAEMAAEGTAIRYLTPASQSGFPLVPTGPLYIGTGAARRLVLPFSIGSLGRNTLRNPGQAALDISIGRRIRIREKIGFQVRMEAFNALNKVNFGSAASGLSVAADATGRVFWNAPGFGLITGTRNARFVQLVGKFEF